MNKFKLFPRSQGSNRSCEFEVKCGEAGLLSAFNLPCGYSVCINKIEGDKCSCEHFEKQYCELGNPSGINDETCEGVIAMPGKYVAVLCYPQGSEPDTIDTEWAVYVNVCAAHQNLQTLAMAASLESN